MKRGYLVTSAWGGRGTHWLLSAIVGVLLVASYAVVLAAIRPQVVLAATTVTVTFTADDKVYDANTDATILSCAIQDDVGTADVACQPKAGEVADFADPNVADGIAVSADPSDFELTGADSGDFVIGDVVDTSANITERDLTPVATGENKIYDGGTTATVTFTDDRIGGDTFDYTYSAAFNDKNVGTKSVSVTSIAISGDDAGNYQLTTTTASTTADITQRDLTPNATGVNRGYDGSTVATVTFSDDRVENDVFTYSYTAAFDDRNAGTGKPISVTSISISGTDAENYNLLTTSDTTSANVAKAPLTVTAVANVKTADGNTSAAATPTVAGATYSPDSENFIETYDTQAAGSGKTLTPSGTMTDGNGGNNYSYDFQTVATGQIRPAPAASVEFVTEPIDTKTGTPIYSVCVPSAGTAPCALAGTTSTTSTPIKVLAKDAFGNNAGPGSPGADGTTAPVNIQIRRDSALGTSLGNATTSNGVAAFGDQLVISGVGASNKLHAAATSGATASPSPDLSHNFAIVTDLRACDDDVCNNNGNNNAGNKLQKAAGQIRTDGDFFDPGTTNVLLSTRFTDGSDTNQTACGFKPAVGRTPAVNATIGQATDLQVTGANVAGTEPDTAMVLIMPKNSLKTFGITSRGTNSFNICLGALKIDPDSPIVHWQGKKSDPKQSGLVSSQSGSEGREWGVPADCGTAGLSPEDPCIGIRTKQASALRSYLSGIGWTTAQINALGFTDADFAIVLRKGSPWDGKGGLY